MTKEKWKTAIVLDDIEQESALLQARLARISEIMEGRRAEIEKQLPTRQDIRDDLALRDVSGHPCAGRTLRRLQLMNQSAQKICEDTGADCLCSDLEDLQPLN